MKVAERSRGQMSDSFMTAVFIILSGGFQDAYTYTCRGEVFANAQTGNIVLLSRALFWQEWYTVLKYIIPVISFVIGAAITEYIHIRMKNRAGLHWRQIILAGEIALLLIVGFLPGAVDPLANALVSFVCAMQVRTYLRQHHVHRQSALGHRSTVQLFPRAGQKSASQSSHIFRRDICIRYRRGSWQHPDGGAWESGDMDMLCFAVCQLCHDVRARKIKIFVVPSRK